MKTKMSTKKVLILVLLVLIFACLFFISSLRSSSQRSAEQYPWTTDITVYNNTDKTFCRVWFDQPSIGLLSYIFTTDQLDPFMRLKPGEKIIVPNQYFSYGTYYLWLQECGTLIWDSSLIKGGTCGPEKDIQVGEPTGPSATQTVMAYPIEPAPTPLVTPQFTEQSGGLSGLYFYSSEDAQWVGNNSGVHYVHTLLRFYEDGLVIGTYLEFDELKELDYITSELAGELHHFNRYNALGKPNENGIELGGRKDFYIPGTLYQRRFAYGRYYIEGDQIWFTLTNEECHHSTLTDYEWVGSEEYVGVIEGDLLRLEKYPLLYERERGVVVEINANGPYGHKLYGRDNKNELVIERQIPDHTIYGGLYAGEEQTFQRVDIDFGDE